MKKFITLITVLSVVLGITGNALAVEPVITANRSGDTSSVTGSSFQLTISLDAETSAGEDADWWLLYTDGSSWFYYNLSRGWDSGVVVSYQGSLADLNSTIIGVSNLSAGSYTFYFGVDTVINGSIDTGTGESYHDSVVVNVTSTGSYKVPDTGQVTSYTDIFGEDSDFTVNPPTYIDNGNGTVTDNVTGLIWQQEHAFDTKKILADAESSCNSLTLAGNTDWRLPTLSELTQIVHYDQTSPPLNTTFFLNTNTDYYWSSTAFASGSSNAWRVNFDTGQVENDANTSLWFFRCVRGEQGASTKSLTDNGDGTVSDNDTGLAWQQGLQPLNGWEAALNYCDDLRHGGSDDWRLPNIKELQSFIDFTLSEPAFDRSYFPDTIVGNYWSSTTYALTSTSAWGVHFSSGFISNESKLTSYYVKCVRGGE